MSDPITAPPAPEMPCPRCGVGLVMTDRQGIEIDYCPRCRGIWLDSGELDKIIERSAQLAAPSLPVPTASQTQPTLSGSDSSWLNPGQGVPHCVQGSPQPSGWRQDHGQRGDYGGHDDDHRGGHRGGHGSGRSAHNNSFLGRLFR
ncbi:zf-TFIIB domain-containing protein [Muricoccus radiodurans]|uniref:TFIIB-type zinc ribbon-containing protein n=1 Tax=Muricoccus radiodurans TaxID=2231721 RepID=UPI003CEFFB93